MILSIFIWIIINVLTFTIRYMKRFSKGIKMKLTLTTYMNWWRVNSDIFIISYCIFCCCIKYFLIATILDMRVHNDFFYIKCSSPPKQMWHLMKNTDVQKHISRSWGIVNIRRSIKILFISHFLIVCQTNNYFNLNLLMYD